MISVEVSCQERLQMSSTADLVLIALLEYMRKALPKGLTGNQNELWKPPTTSELKRRLRQRMKYSHETYGRGKSSWLGPKKQMVKKLNQWMDTIYV